MATSKTIEITLIRAGPTDWDAQGRLAGAANVPLAPCAVQHLVDLVARTPAPGTVVCGPDDASRAVAGALGCRIKVVPELTEIGLGLWEGMLESDAQQRFTGCFRQWKQNPAAITPPEAEAFESAKARIMSEVARAATGTRTAGQSLAIVLRPLSFAIVREVLEGKTNTDFWDLVGDEVSVKHMMVPRSTLTAHKPAFVRTFLL